MPDTSRTAVVITGDVVGSSRLDADQRTRLLEVLGVASRGVSDLLGPALPLPVDVFRGDGWQLLVTEPHRALRAGLLFRSTLLAFVAPESRQPVDTRMAFARGRVDHLPSARVSEGSGPAFELSRNALADLGDVHMGYRDHLEPGQDEWDLIFRLLDEFIRNWTARQARAVAGALRGWTQEHIGSLWEPSVTQPTVANHLQAAHWEAVLAAVDLYETHFDSASRETSSGPI